MEDHLVFTQGFEQEERPPRPTSIRRGYKRFQFEDETSQFDPKGRWNGGGEYYSRTYTIMISCVAQT